MIPIGWKLSLDDNKNKLELYGQAEWLQGGDNKVAFKLPYVDVKEGEILDVWEQQGTKVNVSLQLIKCVVGNIFVNCTDDLVDYYSQDGEATLQWEVGPDEVRIYLNFR